jgi:hypothetical protein
MSLIKVHQITMVLQKDKGYYPVVSKDTDYILEKDPFPDDTHINVPSGISSTILQELGESSIKIKLMIQKNTYHPVHPTHPKHLILPYQRKETSIIKLRVLNNKIKHHLNIMKREIMVYYAEKQKYKFFHNASFFDYGNVHPRDSFFEERGVQNPFFGERGVDSIIIGSVDLVRGTLFNNLQLRFGKLKAGETIIMFF